MFLTKKHLSRRTILRGMGVSLALPFLDSMVPAQTRLAKTAAAPRPRLCCIEMVHGSAGSTVEGSNKHYWSPEKEGADFEFTSNAGAPGSFPRLPDYRQRHRSSPGRRVRRCRRGRRPFPVQFRISDRGASQADHGSRYFVRHFHRSDVRAAVRPGYAAAFHPALHRERRFIRPLRLRLCLRVFGHDQLGLADAAVADDDRSAAGVRATVRRRRHSRGARAAPAGQGQHTGPHRASRQRAAKRSGRGRPQPAERIS